jgi:copper(I)-binding protein
MTSENGISQMRELKDALNIPAHRAVAHSRSGYHLSVHAPDPSLDEGRERHGDAISKMPARSKSSSR